MIERFIAFLAKTLHWDMASTDHDTTIDLQAPVSPVEPVDVLSHFPAPNEAVASPQERLDRFCTAIRDFEGKPGDPNYVNKNPGNFRCSPVGYLPKYGKVGCSPGGFSVFPTEELGWEYLEASVHYCAVLHPDWMILQFIAHRAPASDGNDPKHYAEVVAADCGVPPTTTLAALLG